MTLLEYCQTFFPDETLFSLRDGRLAVRVQRLKELEDAWKFSPVSPPERQPDGNGLPYADGALELMAPDADR